MPNFTPFLNPQPEPPLPAIIVIENAASAEGLATAEIVTHAGVIEVNLKQRRVTLKHPEKGDPRTAAAAHALSNAISTWLGTGTGKGLRQIHANAEELLCSTVEAFLTVPAAK